MNEYILKNGLRLIHKKTDSSLASISIAIDAGASRDMEGKLGIAHATEHMVYKGTKTRSEDEINKSLSEIFGFQNAMTNYPYVIYYGTLLNDDLENAVELFSDILINPSFKEEGFKEEMSVIKEELNEWDEEVSQFCEDTLFYNCYKKRRIKYPIIGVKEDLENLTMEDIKVFYNKFYCANNSTVVIASSMEFLQIKSIIEKYFGKWNKKFDIDKKVIEEKGISSKYINKRKGINSSKVLITYDISKLSYKELKNFRIFNELFGEGINSLLFNSLRTKTGLVYDVLTYISNEKHINLYKITFGTASEKVSEALNEISSLVLQLEQIIDKLTDEDIKKLVKQLKLRRLFKEEQTIRLTNQLAMYDVMFNDYKIYLEEIENLEDISKDTLKAVVKKVLVEPCIQIVQ